MREFTRDLCAALRSELEAMLNVGGIFLDDDRLKGGDFYNQALARNLYESATMVMVYTPTYFDSVHTYCTREYKAMLALERDRLSRLRLSGLGNHGLIIPIVLRGASYLPDEIKAARLYHNFESFQLGGRRLSRHPRFAPVIRQIATYICDRYLELQSLPEDVFQAHEQFSLPDETEIRSFLSIAAGFKMPFPRGGISCAPPSLPARP